MANNPTQNLHITIKITQSIENKHYFMNVTVEWE
jgi:hypothetical protein